MICQDFPPVARGAGYYVYNLSKKLIERGYKVTIFTRGSWKKTYCEEIDGISVYRVRFAPVYPFHLQFHGFFINKLIKAMESNFDVIHLHNPLIPVIRTSLPTIITELGTVKGGVAHREALDLFSLGLKIFAKLYISIEQKLVSNVDKVTAVSNSCAHELKSYYGIKDVEVVYNGVDTNFFVPSEMRNEDEPYILYTGSLDALKGLTDLIRSAKYVCQEYQNVEFIMVGRGPLEKKLKKLVHDLGLEEKICFTGYVNREVLLKYYQNATIFVLPSYHEGLPTAILEAMACGLPVVATAVTGTSEVILDGETGLLIPPKRPDKLTNAILRLLINKELREKMSKNAKEYVKRNFTWDIIAKNFEEIYVDMVNKKYHRDL